jgi:hypothetical protein
MHAVGKREVLQPGGPGSRRQSTAGLNRAIIRAVVPSRVGTKTAAHATVDSAFSTTDAIAWAAVVGWSPAIACRRSSRDGWCFSV